MAASLITYVHICKKFNIHRFFNIFNLRPKFWVVLNFRIIFDWRFFNFNYLCTGHEFCRTHKCNNSSWTLFINYDVLITKIFKFRAKSWVGLNSRRNWRCVLLINCCLKMSNIQISFTYLEFITKLTINMPPKNWKKLHRRTLREY